MMVIVMMAMLTMMLMMMLRMPIYSTILYYTTVVMVMVMMMTESALHWLVSIRYCAAVPLELSAMLRSRHTSTMAGLGNMVRARAELASWPQFAGHFEAEEAMVEEGLPARPRPRPRPRQRPRPGRKGLRRRNGGNAPSGQ